MLKDFISVMFWFIWQDIKNWFARKYSRASDIFFIHVFHKRHIFNFSDNWYSQKDIYNSKCLFCPKTLHDAMESSKPDWRGLQGHRGILLALFMLATFAHADDFLHPKPDSLFYYNSLYTFSVVLTTSKCDSLFPCILNFTDGVHAGGYLFGLKDAGPGDTLRAQFKFDARALPGPAAKVSFTGPDGHAKADWHIQLGYADPKPTGVRKASRRVAIAPWPLRGIWRVNGRVSR